MASQEVRASDIVRSVYTAKPGRRGGAKQWAYERIKEMILTSSGGTSEFLGEEALAAQLGVSRTPVREAFLRLEAEHLLQLVPGKGAFIPTVTEAEIGSVIEVRGLVEVFAGRRLAAGESPGDERERAAAIAGIRDSYEAQADALADGQEGVVQFIFLDRKFHRELVGSAGNPVLLDIYEQLRDREMRMDAQVHGKFTGRLQEAHKEHGAIVEALERADPDGVEEAIRVHLANTSFAIR